MLNIPKKEQEILDFWKQHNTFQKSLDKESPEGDYVFFEGPPTANGRPGLHHVLARAFKDVMCRYKTMRGYRVLRKAGWDTHGLPVEIEVEKQIGISGKPDIEKYGIEKFNAKARESVWRYKGEWEKLTERIGFWIDMRDPYITYDNMYIESVWSILQHAWDKKLLYQGHKVVHHCPRCGTTLSTHEIAQGYKTVTEPSVYVKFQVTKGNDIVQSGEKILSWTTTPWTLPGNVALAVGQDIEYVKITLKKKSFDPESPRDEEQVDEGEVLVLAKARVTDVIKSEYTVEGEFTGSHLDGIEYKPMYELPALVATGKKAHYITTADFVTTEEGSGVVHTAVVYGEDDYQLGLEKDLPMVPLLNEDGVFNENAPKQLQKLNFKEGDDMVFLDLAEKGMLFRKEDYTHTYPFCWRCDSPLIYMAKQAWFIKMTALRNELLKNAEKITWYPKHIKEGRFGEWLEGVKDWAISRERYWGTPLPIWQCEKCQAFRCLGSFDELPKKMDDVHRPYIDTVVLTCDCGGSMKRVPEVIDTWFDSGSMPFAQYHYPFENKNVIDKGELYPADYITEAIDQTRGWFYTLLAVSTILGKGTSYKNVICLGHINDAKGKKMSKSKGNTVDPWMITDKYGVDALRYHLYTINQPGESKSFDEKNVLDVSRKVLMTLTNVVAFYKLYTDEVRDVQSENLMDRWLMARLHGLNYYVTNALDADYDITAACRALGEFVNDLSVWYVRRSRARIKEATTRAEAVTTLRSALKQFSMMTAPFMPFIAEYVWQEVTSNKEDSVHLASWPTYIKKMHDEDVLKNMETLRNIVENVHALRATQGIKVRQPLSKLEIMTKLSDEYLEIIAEEVNVKEVMVVKTLSTGKDIVSDEQKTVALHIALNDELKAEGTLRELVRAINAYRKKLALKPGDLKTYRIHTTSTFLQEEVIGKFKEHILSQTSASGLQLTDRMEKNAEKLNVNGEDLFIEL